MKKQTNYLYGPDKTKVEEPNIPETTEGSLGRLFESISLERWPLNPKEV